MHMDTSFLKEAGLSDGEVKVYGAVLEIGRSSLNNIHEKTGIERRNIYDILNKLIEKGLVSYILEAGVRHYQATHPTKVLEYIDSKKKDIERVSKEIEPKISELVKVFNSTKSPIGAEVYRGNEAIKALLEESLGYKDAYWIGGNKGLDHYFPIWWKHFDSRRIKKGVRWHDLADYGLFLSGYAKVGHDAKRLYEVRHMPKDLASPMVIFVFGNKVAQILWSSQSFAFVMESQEIKESFMRYFWHFWEIGAGKN